MKPSNKFLRLIVVLTVVFTAGSFTSIGPYLGRHAASVVLRMVAGPPIIEAQEALTSPNGGSSVTIVRVNSGGATVDFSYELRLRAEPSSEDYTKEGKLVWRSYGIEPTNVKWLADNLIEVTIPRPTAGRLTLLERWPDTGVLVIERLY